MTERALVQFAGAGAGVAELSWGQREMWSVMRMKGRWLPIGGVRQLPAGRTVADVVADLGFVMTRHQSMRTKLAFTADGTPLQVVENRGEIPLEIVDAGDEDPAKVAAAVADRYKAASFDYEADWPVRMGVITARGVATHVAEVFCHHAVDAFGIAALHDDLAARYAGGGQVPPVTATQPLDQAIKQRGPAARRTHDAAMRYAERLLRAAPATPFRESDDPRSPRIWQLTCTSPAGYRAVRVLAAQAGVSTAPVLLAAFAVAVTELTGVSPAALHMVVNNRFRPGFARSVSAVTQSCPCVIDPSGGFREVITRAFHAAMGAYKNSYYDLDGKSELFARIGAELGAEPDLSCLFNDRRVDSREAADTPGGADPAGLRAELDRTTLTWGERNDVPEQKLFLYINDAPDALSYDLWADTCYVSPADMETFVRRFESVLVDAATEGAP
jgi:Condensation domain